MTAKTQLITLKPGDKFLNHLGVESTVVEIGSIYDCIDGYDFHCSKGQKFDVTFTCKLPAWEELQTYTLSFWKETEVIRK